MVIIYWLWKWNIYVGLFNVMILDIMYVYFVFFFYVEIVDIGESLDVLGNIRSKYGVRYWII